MTGRIHKPYSWPEESVALLRKLWLEGHAASDIARQIGHGVNKNAVIGKAARLGLPGHATGRISYRTKLKQARVQFRREAPEARAYRPGVDPRPSFSEKR